MLRLELLHGRDGAVVIRGFRRLARGALLLSLAVMGCDSSAVNTVDESAIQYSENGPFVKGDTDQLIQASEWTSTPGSGGPNLPEGADAAVLPTSTPTQLRIGTTGNLCYPHVLITVVTGPPAVELLVEIGPPVVEGDIQCPDLLTSHEFELGLDQEIDLDRLTLSVVDISGR